MDLYNEATNIIKTGRVEQKKVQRARKAWRMPNFKKVRDSQ
jgi:hypothetical protein